MCSVTNHLVQPGRERGNSIAEETTRQGRGFGAGYKGKQAFCAVLHVSTKASSLWLVKSNQISCLLGF